MKVKGPEAQECRHTSEMLQLRFQVTALKGVIIFLLVERLAFNLLKRKKTKKQHL